MVAFAHRDEFETAGKDPESPNNGLLSSFSDADLLSHAPATAVEMQTQSGDTKSCWSHELFLLPPRKDFCAADLRARLVCNLRLEHRFSSAVSSSSSSSFEALEDLGTIGPEPTDNKETATETEKSPAAPLSMQMILRKVFIWVDIGSTLAPRRELLLVSNAGRVALPFQYLLFVHVCLVIWARHRTCTSVDCNMLVVWYYSFSIIVCNAAACGYVCVGG